VKYYFIISVIFTDPFGIFTNKGGLSIWKRPSMNSFKSNMSLVI
jgi:hypothetical protein